METFVFALHLQQLRRSALVLRLQLHNPRKRTVAECVLSLRQLDSQETEHWLELNSPSKSSVSFTSCVTSQTCGTKVFWVQSEFVRDLNAKEEISLLTFTSPSL